MKNISELTEMKEGKLYERCFDIAEVMLIVLDRNGTILAANRNACAALSVSREKLIGMDWLS